MRKFFVIALVFKFLFMAPAGAIESEKKAPRYPKISELHGEVLNEREVDKAVKLKVKEVLLEKAHLKVGNNALLKLELDASSRLVIFENSVVEIPVITWGESEIPEIKLEKGKIFYECEKNCRRWVSTPLSREVLVNGESFLEYVPESPRVELLVLHGSQDFKGLENEESVKVHNGEKVVFQGLKESGEVAYDYLLKGRKVARGKLQPIVKLSESEFNSLEKMFQRELEATKPVVKRLVRGPKQICENPFGELNQCVWEGCLRRRCDANGKWSDPQQTPAPCEKKARIGPCDY